jgi:predicted enzyme related to lactoylglutathione lyase
MSNVGKIGWLDISVKNAPELRDFYEKVIGWSSTNLGDDFCMNLPDGETTVAGICHALGDNAKLPPFWLPYVNVADVGTSVKQVLAFGGRVVDGPRKLGERDFCCIQDPAGAYIALIQADED